MTGSKLHTHLSMCAQITSHTTATCIPMSVGLAVATKIMSPLTVGIYWFGTQQNVKFSEKSRLEIEWAKRWGERNE